MAGSCRAGSEEDALRGEPEPCGSRLDGPQKAGPPPGHVWEETAGPCERASLPRPPGPPSYVGGQHVTCARARMLHRCPRCAQPMSHHSSKERQWHDDESVHLYLKCYRICKWLPQTQRSHRRQILHCGWKGAPQCRGWGPLAQPPGAVKQRDLRRAWAPRGAGPQTDGTQLRVQEGMREPAPRPRPGREEAQPDPDTVNR